MAYPDRDKQFHALHAGPDLLILANAWDALSARVVAEAGAKAIATSSAAVAWAHGRADGHCLPFETLRSAVAEITRVVSLPVSVDMEGGYAEAPKDVAENVARVIAAGAIGMNIEDGEEGADALCRKIEAARAICLREGVDFFINARTDVYLRNLAAGEAALEAAIARGRAYKQAGANGFFLPGPVDLAILRAAAAEVGLPLNAMSRKGLPGKGALTAAGVRRLSAATGMARAAMRALQEAAEAFLREGDPDDLAARAGASVDFNAWFASEAPAGAAKRG
ncbi:MAG: isocitrate lyase/phosphoenolpyruvate mutase family protein [Hyphomonadaceae bacterium]